MKIISDAFQFISESRYLKFLAALVITIIIAFLAKIILKHVLKPLAEKTKTKIDDLIIKSLSSIIFYIALLLGLKVGLQDFELGENIQAVFDGIINTFLILIVTVLYFTYFVFRASDHCPNLIDLSCLNFNLKKKVTLST